MRIRTWLPTLAKIPTRFNLTTGWESVRKDENHLRGATFGETWKFPANATKGPLPSQGAHNPRWEDRQGIAWAGERANDLTSPAGERDAFGAERDRR